MNKLEDILFKHLIDAFKATYDHDLTSTPVKFQKTNKDFEGDITLNVFPLLRFAKQKAPSVKPEELAESIGEQLSSNCEIVTGFNVAKGFLNLVITNGFWLKTLQHISDDPHYGHQIAQEGAKTMMIEYSSPNTNKPLHLGHIRNNLLGHSVAEILKAAGNKVIKTNLVNDRGIHICKSMLAWQKWGNGETPESSGMKGDKLVGKYYVKFDTEYKTELKSLMDNGLSKEEAETRSGLMDEVKDLLRKWEAGDKETVALWKKMNDWVYSGFDVTYKDLGISFDKVYYESNTYLLGKQSVEDGLKKGVFFKKEDGSVWIDLTNDGLDQKLLLRSDGTSVYMTQDIGTAIERFKEYPQLNGLIYTVGNEQDYHFKVLFLILSKLGYQWAQECYHLSYGMVELPEGKMKSREGTVVDADDLIEEMISTAKATTLELGKIDELSAEEAEALFKKTGLGALKYFILKVDPKKKMLFDPKDSIDFNGHTGPFIQYTFARIRSILRKAASEHNKVPNEFELAKKEKDVLKLLYRYPEIVQESAKTFNPSHIANYIYELAKHYNQFYHDHSILKEENNEVRDLRLTLSAATAQTIKNGMQLLGIEVPERM